MTRPFIFGVPVEGEYFIGREMEHKRLATNFASGINTILLSPRRWGKTSLVRTVADSVRSKDTVVVLADAFPCRDEYDFYNMLSAAVIRQTSSGIDDWKNTAAGFIERLVPKISLSPDGVSEFSLSLGITPKTHRPEEVLNLPEVIAQRKKCHIVICIDEFQQVGEFSDSLNVQKKMRSVWQHQQNVSYCLYGSKMHMMTALFQKKSYPFYKFGDMLYLKPIPIGAWEPYITHRFEMSGKSVSDEIIRELCETVEYHSSYVQQYAWCLFENTDGAATEIGLKQAFNDLIDQNSQLFIQQTESLTSYQLNFLRAVLDGNHRDFGCRAIREGYNLGSSSNISRLKTALIDRELIELTADGVQISDPLLRLWLRRIL